MNISVVVAIYKIMFEFQVLFIAGADSDIEIVVINPSVSESHRHIFLNS